MQFIMNKVFADGDVKGNAVKIRGGLATVTGDKGFNMPLGVSWEGEA